MAQSYAHWELIVINDASSDSTDAIAQDLAAQDPRIRVIFSGEGLGAAGARNLGLAQSTGRYVAFLDSDDLWHRDKLDRQLAFMQSHAIALSYCGYLRVSESGQLIETVTVPTQVSYTDLLRRNEIGCLTAIYDSTIFGKIPMPNLQRQHDYALWLQLARTAGPVMGLNDPLATYRVRRGSLSANKRLAAIDMWAVFRHHEGLPWGRSLYYFARYVVHSMTRRLIQRPQPAAPFVTDPLD